MCMVWPCHSFVDGLSYKCINMHRKSQINSLSCFLLNAHSTNNKKGELESCVCTLKPCLVMITESWARGDINYAELSIDDFVIFCSDR